MKIRTLALAAITACSMSLAFGQSGVTLTVGNPAPQLKVSTWIKGTPTENFDTDKIYVVEFWATWCGPCRQMMPHLSEMAKKYAGKVTFDSFDVWENSESETPLAASEVLTKVKQFVADMGDKMSYNIAADTSDGYMAKNWMKAAGQDGIPTAFLIKKGQVIWIGHPYVIEKTIDQVLAGTYDQAAYAKDYDKKMQANAARAASWKAVMDPIKKAMAAKDYAAVIPLVDAGVKAVPVLKTNLYMDKFKALTAMDPNKALDFLKGWHKDSAEMAAYTIGQCADEDGLPTDFYRLGVTYTLEEISSPDAILPFAYDKLAKFYVKLGDAANAVSSEEKAIELGDKAIKAGQYSGSILPGDVKKMRDRLEGLKASKG
ncbi:MAG TPA: TlpA family protein disulfide reductase [Fimbriimonadaceae bacterium]